MRYYRVLSFWNLFFPSPIFQRVVKNFYTICFYTFFSFFFNLVLNIFLHSQNCFLTFVGILINFGGSQQSKNEFSECCCGYNMTEIVFSNIENATIHHKHHKPRKTKSVRTCAKKSCRNIIDFL